MKILSLSATIVLLSVSYAQANCWNNEDRSSPIREFTTCFDGKCIDDKILWECANSTWFGIEFRGGFQVSCKAAVQGTGYDQVLAPADCKYFLGHYQLTQKHLDLFTCEPKEAGGYGCEWFEND